LPVFSSLHRFSMRRFGLPIYFAPGVFVSLPILLCLNRDPPRYHRRWTVFANLRNTNVSPLVGTLFSPHFRAQRQGLFFRCGALFFLVPTYSLNRPLFLSSPGIPASTSFRASPPKPDLAPIPCHLAAADRPLLQDLGPSALFSR